MRKAAVLVLLTAATAWGGAGMFLAEMGIGAGIGGGAFFGTYAFSVNLEEDWDFIVPSIAFMAGAGSGVYLAGELFDGRSGNPWTSLGVALGGAAVGTAVGATPGLLAAKGSGDEGRSEWAVFWGAVGGVAAGTAVSTSLYNLVKKPAAGGRSSLRLPTPAVSVLRRRPGENAPTLVYGCAWSF